MILGIGVDIVETARIEKLITRFGSRFASRILTESELEEFERRDKSCLFLSTRFAAKEAIAKALGTGIGHHFGFHSFQIEHDSLGKPQIRFVGDAAGKAADRDIGNAMISLSDERHYVVAMVVLESASR